MFTIKLMSTVAFAFATIAVPATAQTTTGSGGMASPTTDPQSGTMSSGSMQNGSMQGGSTSDGTMSDGSMSTSGMHRMTKSQTATMKRCQKMTPAKMAKNKSCMKMQRMQGGMSHEM